jgi:DNA-damage-inducible protein J
MKTGAENRAPIIFCLVFFSFSFWILLVLKIIDLAVKMRYALMEVMKMASNTTYNIRIDAQIRQQADALYKSMGLSLSSAVNLFLTQSVVQQRLPIDEIIPPEFSKAFGEALLRDAAEVDAAIANGTAKIYDSVDELFSAWAAEDESDDA